MERNTHTIDAKGISLGRVATQVAHLLMGKHKPSYVAYRDLGDRVIVSNLKLIK